MFITEEEVRSVLTYGALIPAIREALKAYSAGKVDQLPRSLLRAGNAEGVNNGWFMTMPVVADDMMGVKIVTFYPGNAALGLPTHMAVIELLRRSTGEPLALMDGRLITEMRTASVSAVAFAALAPALPAPPVSLGILGSGVQARAHVQALKLVWPAMGEIRVWSPTPANAQRFAAENGARAVVIEEAAAADVVLTATNSTQPVLQGRWLKPHALVLAVGATTASLRELDDETMLGSSIVAESRSSVERESGDVLLSGAKVLAEIGEILSGKAAVPQGKRLLFKSVGMAIEDLTAAKLVWQARNSSQEHPA